MRFSIITPTHIYNPYLMELWESIKSQTFKDWEWILFLNGEMTNKQVASEISNDKRVKIYRDIYHFDIRTSAPKLKIGDIKKKAFSKGKGDILVEADHDDLLTPDCLKELNKAFTKGVGFVYSDTAFIGLKKPYNAKFGWQSYGYEHEGEKLIVMCAFEPTAEKVQSMWFSPNHVRAWRKSVYNKVGGHDKTLMVADDLDLIIRTFLKTKLKRIAKPLYIYRITGQNSFIKYGYDIKLNVKQIQNKYREELNAIF